MFREGLAALMRRDDPPGVKTCAADFCEAVETARWFQPQAILVDIASSQEPCARLVRALQDACPNAGIVALSESAEDPRVLEAMQAGVVGYVLRSSNRDQLLDAVNNAAAGRPYLPPSVASRVLTHVGHPGRRVNGEDGRASLSSLELHLLSLMTEGLTNREIADRLSVSERTVARRVSQIYGKLGVEDRSTAVLKAIKFGFVTI